MVAHLTKFVHIGPCATNRRQPKNAVEESRSGTSDGAASSQQTELRVAQGSTTTVLHVPLNEVSKDAASFPQKADPLAPCSTSRLPNDVWAVSLDRVVDGVERAVRAGGPADDGGLSDLGSAPVPGAATRSSIRSFPGPLLPARLCL